MDIPVRHIDSKQQRAAASGFKIRALDSVLDGQALTHELHRHDFFFVLALEKGSGIHEIDFTTYSLSDHSLFFLRPGQVHRLFLEADCMGYLMEFDKGFYYPKDEVSKQRFRKASHKNYCSIDISRFERLYSILTFIFEEDKAKEDGYSDIIRANLEIFFIEFVRQSRNVQNDSANTALYAQERLEEFLELMDSNIASVKQASQYADLMNLSLYQLNGITKATIGKTASDAINEHIVLEAKRQLLATPRQVKDIAWHLGYEDPSYFIRFFRKQTGYSPESFRIQFQNSPA